AAWGDADGTWVGGTLQALARTFKVPLTKPWKQLTAKQRELILRGAGDQQLRYEFKLRKGSSWVHHGTFEGVIPNLERRYRETGSESVRKWIGTLMNPTPCPDCHGKRLRPESLAVRIDGDDIGTWSAQSVATARRRAEKLRFDGGAATIA